MKDLPDPIPSAPTPPPTQRPLALSPRPRAPGLDVRPFPGFAAEAGAKVAPIVARPIAAGEGGLARSVGTFGCSAVAGLVLATFTIGPTRTMGAPRSVRLERDARQRARAVELRDALREAEEGPRDRLDDAR